MTYDEAITAYAYAKNRAAEIETEIRELEQERKACNLRMYEYENSRMLEAERRATAAEPYQTGYS